MFHEMTIHRMTGVLELAFIQHANQGHEFACEAGPVVWRERGVAHRLDSKDIHDLFPAQARAQFWPLAYALAIRNPCWLSGSRRLRERVDLALLDVQSECRQEPADRREFGEVVVRDDRQVEVAVPMF